VAVNPFFELYVGDRLSSEEFVDIFSPYLVRHAEALFIPGNVVVKGMQGSGKSMLLALLKPEVRIEYARAGATFPVRSQISQFIGAGINLAHSNAIDFSYRQISPDQNETALFFADFVNYTILLDLFCSLRKLSEAGVAELQIDLSSNKQSDFLEALGNADVFQGGLRGCGSLAETERRIQDRLNGYRRFLHLNDKQLDPSIRDSKTDIGTPVAVAVQLMKAAEIVGSKVPIFIHIDQYEELANISPSETHRPDYRRVINRALARRDSAVSYRIGTRGHAWRNHGFIFGGNVKLEEERDYKTVDLDLILRRNENRKTWVYPGLVGDVFARRLKYAELAPKQARGRQLLEKVFGPGMSPGDKARKYAGKNRSRAVKVDADWSADMSHGLLALAEEDPLSARLLEAWVLQKLSRDLPTRTGANRQTLKISVLEEMLKKPWWIKERIDLALMQIAGRCAQRPLWSGVTELIELSGGNILVFISICQFIWDTQTQVGRMGELRSDLSEIEAEVQAIGVFKASEYWLAKIPQETGRSGDRFRLARQIGNALSRLLYLDRKMSYPGHNGFSVADDELEQYPHVKNLLEEMSDYGTIVATPHTTKEKDRRSRHKFYLNPVLCPQFKMHYKRLKEPVYMHPANVEQWMKEAGLPLPASYRPHVMRGDSPNLSLFDE
jgi:hypothetical protein